MKRIFRQFTVTSREILYGMAIHDQVRTLAKQRGSLEHLFVLISFGDLLGVPVLGQARPGSQIPSHSSDSRQTH